MGKNRFWHHIILYQASGFGKPTSELRFFFFFPQFPSFRIGDKVMGSIVRLEMIHWGNRRSDLFLFSAPCEPSGTPQGKWMGLVQNALEWCVVSAGWQLGADAVQVM